MMDENGSYTRRPGRELGCGQLIYAEYAATLESPVDSSTQSLVIYLSFHFFHCPV